MKTLTYNQIISFFNRHGLPLTDKQTHLIQCKIREETAKLEEKKNKRKERSLRIAKG
jgi:hypothetical protein